MSLMVARGGRNPRQSGGTWTTEYVYTLNANAAGDGSCAYRVIVPALSKNISKIRISVRAYGSGATIVDHVSVGVRSGSSDDCTGIPTEVTFSSNAAHGFNIANGSVLVSDDTNFAAAQGDQLLIPIDFNSANGGIAYNAAGGLCYRATATTSWNTATATMTLGGGGIQQAVVSQIEVFG